MNRKNAGANTNSGQMCLDILVLILAYLIILAIYFEDILNSNLLYKSFAVAVIFSIIYMLSNKEARIYNSTFFFYFDRFFKIISKSWCIAAAVTTMLMFVLTYDDLSRKVFLAYLAVSYVLLSINVIFSRLLAFLLHTYQAPRAAFVGVFSEYQKFNYFLNKTSVRIEEIGYILKKDQESEGRFNVLGTVDDIEEIIRTKEVDQIYFLQKSNESIVEIQPYIDVCMEMGVTAKIIIDAGETRLMKKSNSFVSSIGTYPVVTYHTVTLNSYEQLVKRILDIVVSAVGIILTCPIMLITAIAIKIDSPGPVLFKQTRVGMNGRLFKVYKFRSMRQDAEALKAELMEQNEMKDSLMFKMKDDPRITKVGKFIRKTSIDELPQFFNVLEGTMSVVGTRPPTTDEVSQYKRSQWRRISIKPGITGIWQVSGRSNITDFDKVVEMDLRYIDNWSLWLDIKIIFKTVGVVLKHDDAY